MWHTQGVKFWQGSFNTFLAPKNKHPKFNCKHSAEEPPVSDHPKCQASRGCHLQEVVAYESLESSNEAKFA